MNPTTLAVKLSPLLVVGDNSNYGLTVAITGLTATQYMVIYYGGFRMSPTSLYAVVVKGNVRSNGTLSVGMPVAAKAFPGYSLNGYFKATTLDSGDVVVAYADSNVNQGVVCALLTVNINTGAILNGPQLTIATGSSLASYSAISIVTIGTGSQFMVMFADLIVNRAVVAAIGQVTIAPTPPPPPPSSYTWCCAPP